VSQRPTLTLTYTTLPVTPASFTAHLQKQDVVLNWLTNTEINNLYFSIEHSTNGTSFTETNRVNGAGNSVLPKRYSFSHLNVSSGKHYYRLAQYDFNGSLHYSQVVVAGINGKNLLLQLTPNPAQSVINIRLNELVTGRQYRITNNMGQVLIAGKLMSQQIAVGNLAKGSYRLTIKGENGESMTATFEKL